MGIEDTVNAMHERVLRNALALPTNIEDDLLLQTRDKKLDGYEMMVGLWAEVRALRIVAYYTHPLLERILQTVTDISTAITDLQGDEEAIAAALTAAANASTAATAEMGVLIASLVAEQTLVGNGPAQLAQLQTLHTQLSALPAQLTNIANALTAETSTAQAADPTPPSSTTTSTAGTGTASTVTPVATASTVAPTDTSTIAAATVAPSEGSTTVTESDHTESSPETPPATS